MNSRRRESLIICQYVYLIQASDSVRMVLLQIYPCMDLTTHNTIKLSMLIHHPIVHEANFWKFHLNSINFCRGFGPNCENTNIKLVMSMPTFSFYADDFTAKVNVLSLPAIATRFSMTATGSEYLRTNNIEFISISSSTVHFLSFKPFRCVFSLKHPYHEPD